MTAFTIDSELRSIALTECSYGLWVILETSKRASLRDMKYERAICTRSGGASRSGYVWFIWFGLLL